METRAAAAATPGGRTRPGSSHCSGQREGPVTRLQWAQCAAGTSPPRVLTQEGGAERQTPRDVLGLLEPAVPEAGVHVSEHVLE